MKRAARFTLILALLVVSLAAQAATFESSTSVFLSLRDCVPGETPCDSISVPVHKAIEGLPGNRHSEGEIQDPGYGKAAGSATLAGSTAGSEHGAHALSLPGARNAVTSSVLRKYTNPGPTAQTLRYVGTLSYEQTVPEENAGLPEDSSGHSRAMAMMGAARMGLEAIEGGTTAEDNFFAVSEGPGEEVEIIGLGQDRADSEGVSGSGKVEMDVALTVEPGESIWLWAVVQAIAANGAEVSADVVTSLEETAGDQ